MKKISITELRRQIGDIEQSELIVITKYGSPTHVIVPVGVLEIGLVANLERGIAMMMEYHGCLIEELKENQ